ncbi:hypothetical protein F4780DRAFT_19939 [Xylariomycetidae sp. FL0641]|nr:hypothetical protein F4780DRAFT_19939 [Xylariomycetidae sp. FL0641]
MLIRPGLVTQRPENCCLAFLTLARSYVSSSTRGTVVSGASSAGSLNPLWVTAQFAIHRPLGVRLQQMDLAPSRRGDDQIQSGSWHHLQQKTPYRCMRGRRIGTCQLICDETLHRAPFFVSGSTHPNPLSFDVLFRSRGRGAHGSLRLDRSFRDSRKGAALICMR